jgi:hypothetical protein
MVSIQSVSERDMAPALNHRPRSLGVLFYTPFPNNRAMSQEVLTGIVNQIAEAEDVEPSELELSLYDHIDIDSVVQLVNAEKGNWKLSFDVQEYTVTVWSDGSVLVESMQQFQPAEHSKSVCQD